VIDQIVVPDTSATKDVDLLELKWSMAARRARADIKANGESDLALGVIADSEKILAKLEGSTESRPSVTIGYIPVRKLSSLRNARFALSRDDPDMSREYLDSLEDIIRETVRWGVKGHQGLGFDFESTKEKVGPLEYNVATWEMVDVYERIEMLMDLYTETNDYNTLSEKKSEE
jgi:hypothetical protein